MAEECGEARTAAPVSDEQVLERFGYRQELKRSLGYFSAFALSFSVISVTTGLFANYGSGLQIGGPAFIWTWLIVGVGQLLSRWCSPNWRGKSRSPDMPISGPANLRETASPGGPAGS